MSKFIMDAVWGEIEVTPFALQFLDVYEFQRMRFMKQLGTCNFIYTCAETSRFAHSLGVYHLANKVMSVLKRKHPDIVTDRHCRLIPIAALYHDIGHGPFSHLFDKITDTRHEDRSKQILRYVVDKYKIQGIKERDLVFMEDAIAPGGSDWYHSILSSDTADIDRMDYLVRDSHATGMSITLNTKSVLKLIDRSCIVDGRWHFPHKVQYIVDDLMYSRTYMYERVYLHPVTVKIEALIKEATGELFMTATDDLDVFLSLSDAVLQEIYLANHSKAIERIFTRNF